MVVIPVTYSMVNKAELKINICMFFHYQQYGGRYGYHQQQEGFFQVGLVFQEEPVGEVYFNGAGVQEGVVVLIVDQGALEHHFIE